LHICADGTFRQVPAGSGTFSVIFERFRANDTAHSGTFRRAELAHSGTFAH
jgi:hypothetical protein